MNIQASIEQKVKTAIQEAFSHAVENIQLEHPADLSHGDYASNIALQLTKELHDSPRSIAGKIVGSIEADAVIEKIEVAGPGFINFYIKKEVLLDNVNNIANDFGANASLQGRKIAVEYAHPNTHKEMHIGHMRTLIVGEALARILKVSGATVFRANYQGDIGPHVAKAIYGTREILRERGMSFEDVEKLSNTEKAHLLGEGYVRGNKDYELYEEEIKDLNKKLYAKDSSILEIYNQTRQWSLDYYDELYTRFGTNFDAFYFESQMAEDGVRIVRENVGKVFEESDGAIIFDGERRGLHKRVFITSDGYPTYEGKDMALAPKQYKDFQFDRIIHVVGDEQSGYFKVVIKALEELYPELEGKEYHLPMGMVNLKGLKMSSRTGVLITVDGLLDEVRERVKEVMQQDRIGEGYESVLEAVTLAAVKYSVLKNDPKAYVLFDIEESINLNGNSGPYLQYTHARCRSVLEKAGEDRGTVALDGYELNTDEDALLRTVYQFPEVVEKAAEMYGPNLIANFLFDIAQKYNALYQSSSILTANSPKERDVRLLLTSVTALILRQGLYLLGIEAPDKM